MRAPSNHVLTLGDRQDWRCIWCELPMVKTYEEGFELAKAELPGRLPVSLTSLSKESRRRFARGVTATFDHVIPKADGGGDGLENGLASCKWCNNYRGTEEPEAFKERITALVHRGAHPRQIFRQTGRWPSGMPLKGAIGNGGTWRSEAAI